MNYLLCSVGRRGELLKNLKESAPKDSVLVATDNSIYAPALYFADKKYIVPKIYDPSYIDVLLDICKKESINVITTFIDPEIQILSNNRERFSSIGVEVLAPFPDTARLCFDKFEMYKFLVKNGINTVRTWGDITSFKESYNKSEISFPVFVKPRTGSGSVGARKINTMEDVITSFIEDPTIIVQEYMQCEDIDADVYIDTISHKAVSAFSKKKIETRIGGASKTISFVDERLFDFISKIVAAFDFNGPVDMDFFYKDGEYYLSEINPRFGGAYLHAYGAGVNFFDLIENNLNNIENNVVFGNYEEGIVMMMYDSVVICNKEDIAFN